MAYYVDEFLDILDGLFIDVSPFWMSAMIFFCSGLGWFGETMALVGMGLNVPLLALLRRKDRAAKI